MKYTDSSKLGFNTTLIAALSGTLGHYLDDMWFLCYLLSAFAGLITATIFYE